MLTSLHLHKKSKEVCIKTRSLAHSGSLAANHNYFLFHFHRDGSCKFSLTVNSEPEKIQPGQEFDTSALGHGVLCCFSPSGNFFALCTPQKELFIWQTSNWKLLNKRYIAVISIFPATVHVEYFLPQAAFHVYLYVPQ